LLLLLFDLQFDRGNIGLQFGAELHPGPNAIGLDGFQGRPAFMHSFAPVRQRARRTTAILCLLSFSGVTSAITAKKGT
jgi:hypothetical protein